MVRCCLTHAHTHTSLAWAKRRPEYTGVLLTNRHRGLVHFQNCWINWLSSTLWMDVCSRRMAPRIPNLDVMWRCVVSPTLCSSRLRPNALWDNAYMLWYFELYHCRWVPTFRRNTLLISTGLKSNASKQVISRQTLILLARLRGIFLEPEHGSSTLLRTFVIFHQSITCHILKDRDIQHPHCVKLFAYVKRKSLSLWLIN
jgi:hypothetical protein